MAQTKLPADLVEKHYIFKVVVNFFKTVTVLKSRNLLLFSIFSVKLQFLALFKCFIFKKPLFSLMLILVELAAAANNFVI